MPQKKYTWRDWWKSHEGMRLFGVGWKEGWWAEHSDDYQQPKMSDSLYAFRNMKRILHNFRHCYYRPRVQFYGKIPQMWYYIRCRFWRRYNVFNVKSLTPTWQDSDEKILHVNFHILGEFLNIEQPREHISTEGQDPNDGHSWAWAIQEMETLWHWWMVEYDQHHAEHSRILTEWHDSARADGHFKWMEKDAPTEVVKWTDPDTGKVIDVVEPVNRTRPVDSEKTKALWEELNNGPFSEQALEKEEDEMLIRLIKVRNYMWT